MSCPGQDRASVLGRTARPVLDRTCFFFDVSRHSGDFGQCGAQQRFLGQEELLRRWLQWMHEGGFEKEQPLAITYKVAGFLQFAHRAPSLGAPIPQVRDELVEIVRAQRDSDQRCALGLGKTGAGNACENFLSGAQSDHLCSD